METATGDVLSQPLKFYPILRRATDEQREKYSFNVWGIRWEAIDEDISFESFVEPN